MRNWEPQIYKTNLKIRNYETNKLEKFLVNDFNWESIDLKSATWD